MSHLKAGAPKKVDEKVQWFGIFEYLFPNHQPRPRSPFIDRHLSVELSSFQDYTATEGTRIMMEVFHSHGLVPPATDGERTLSEALLQAAIGEGQELIAARYNAKFRAESSSQSDFNPASMTPDPVASVHAPALSEASSVSSGEVAGRRHLFNSPYPSAFFTPSAPPNSQPQPFEFYHKPSDVPYRSRLEPIYQCPAPRLRAQAPVIRPRDAEFQEQFPSHILDDGLQGVDHFALPSESTPHETDLSGETGWTCCRRKSWNQNSVDRLLRSSLGMTCSRKAVGQWSSRYRR
ncbi:hypothetical protein GE09DRAFT_1061733 [Coniochaeta sp. 2T2.1]|nr:hypothetical protein GE09DRAFT_1061733 [Coniochaeta sp. 2T2.1]